MHFFALTSMINVFHMVVRVVGELVRRSKRCKWHPLLVRRATNMCINYCVNQGSLIIVAIALAQNTEWLDFSHKATNTFSSPRCWQFIRITIPQIFLVFSDFFGYYMVFHHGVYTLFRLVYSAIVVNAPVVRLRKKITWCVVNQ